MRVEQIAPFGKQKQQETHIERSKAPPHIPSIQAVIRFVNEKFPKKQDEAKRQQLCADTYACTPWTVEPLLLHELVNAKQNQNQQKIDEMRKLLRAVSWQEHRQLTKKDFENIIREYSEHTLKETTHYNEPELLENQQKDIEVIERAIQDEMKAEAAYTACDAIENALINAYKEYEHVKMQRAQHIKGSLGEALKKRLETLTKRLHNLRMVRDQLYFQALFANWYLPKNAEMPAPQDS